MQALALWALIFLFLFVAPWIFGSLLVAWIVFNLLVSLMEVVGALNYQQVKVNPAFSQNDYTLNDQFFLDTWGEYSKYDLRYSSGDFSVWRFELVNVFSTILLVLGLALNLPWLLTLGLLGQLVSCTFYFLTFTGSQVFGWYGGISALWIVIPLYLLWKINS